MNDALKKGDLTEEQAKKINEGEDFYFFRNTENIKDKQKTDLYKAYEVIFRIMPILPSSFKRKLLPNHIQKMPNFLIRPMSILADILTGFMLRNPEFNAYAKHNLFHLWKFFMRKLGFRKRIASTVLENVEFENPDASVEPADIQVKRMAV
jgi:hypothetical protein